MTDDRVVSRRGLLAACAGTVAVGAGVGLDADTVLSTPTIDTRVASGQWPMAKRDPRRTGYQPRPGPRTGLVARWQRPVGWTAVVRPGVVAANDRIYTVDRHALRAVATDGTTRWTRRHRDRLSAFDDSFEFVQAGPIVTGTDVTVVSGVTLYAHAPTGRSRWAFRTTSSFERVLPVGDLIVVGCSVGGDARLVALDRASGVWRWTRASETVPLAATAEPDVPTLVTGRSAANGGTRFAGRRLTDGGRRWQTTLDRPAVGTFGTPAIADGRVYAGSETVSALNVTDGRVVWQVEPFGETDSRATDPDPISPVTDGETVYAAGDNTVVALDAATGDRRWRTAIPDSRSIVSPVLTDGTLLVVAGEAVIGLDTADGGVRFHRSVEGTDTTIYGAAVADGRLFLRTERTLRAYDPAEEGKS